MNSLEVFLTELRSGAFSVTVAIAVVYLVGVVYYRLYLHPLARYPGPKIAAATRAYEFYYDAFKGGKYTFEIQRMHDTYGPIVRISPDELHVNEPSFVQELYVAGGKVRDKYPYATAQFGNPDSCFGSVPHDLHRIRRDALNPFFSTAAVAKLEPIIHEKVDLLCQRLQNHVDSGAPVDMTMAFSCMTTDVVTEYAFAKSSNFLDSPDFGQNFHAAIIAGTSIGAWTKQFPWILSLMQSLPDSLVVKMMPDMSAFVNWQRSMQKQCLELEREFKNGKPPAPGRAHATIFHELLTGNLPEWEKRPERLWQEGQLIIGAGTETTAWILTALMFYILNNPSIYARLQKELSVVMPDPYEPVPSKIIESVPYVDAVIHEGLRMAHGITTRLQRIDPTGFLRFRSEFVDKNGHKRQMSYDIPPGTPVGMTAPIMHMNASVFPEPKEFKPERWLDADGKRDRTLDKYILSFSKGSRQCLGINLAYAEMYIALATVMRRFEGCMKLFETDESDVEFASDCFVPVPKAETKGVRVVFSSSDA